MIPPLTLAALLAESCRLHARLLKSFFENHLLIGAAGLALLGLMRWIEIEADTVRIEHQIALICERAAQHSSLGDAGVHVELAISPTDAFADDLPGGSLINEQEAFFRRCSLE